MQITIIGAGNVVRGIPTRALVGRHTARIIDRAPDKAARLAVGLQKPATPPAPVLILMLMHPAMLDGMQKVRGRGSFPDGGYSLSGLAGGESPGGSSGMAGAAASCAFSAASWLSTSAAAAASSSSCRMSSVWPPTSSSTPEASSSSMAPALACMAAILSCARIRKKVSGQTKTEVRDKLRELHQQVDSGLRPRRRYTVGYALEDWLDRGVDGLSARTVTLYRGTIVKALAEELGAVRLTELTASDVQGAPAATG